MKERWLNGCLIKPTEDGGWQISLGIHKQIFKTRSKAVQFALSVRANASVSDGTTGPVSEPQGVSKDRPANGAWVPQCIAGGGQPLKVTKADDYSIIERMFDGCLVDEMRNGIWRVQYQDETPTPAQQRLGFHRVGFHQRTFKTRGEAISFAHSLPRPPDSYRKGNPVQALVDSILGNKVSRRRRLVSRSRKI